MKDVKEADGVADEDNAGAYSARKFVSTYHPFNNERLATYSYTYNLTIKSPVKHAAAFTPLNVGTVSSNVIH